MKNRTDILPALMLIAVALLFTNCELARGLNHEGNAVRHGVVPTTK